MKNFYLFFLIIIFLTSCFTTIHESVRDGDISSVKNYINSNNNINARAEKDFPGHVRITKGMTPLMIAVSSGNYELTKILIEANADYKNTKTILEGNLLHLGQNFDRPRIVKLLIKIGLDVNKKDQLNNTPLNLHCIAGNYESAKVLVEAGADINNFSSTGEPPIIEAAMAKKNGAKIIELLLKNGAKITQADKDGNQAIHLARPPQLDFLLKKGAKIETKDRYGRTPFLRWAAQRYYMKNLEMLKHLAEKGANINAKTRNGFNAIHMAVDTGNDKETLILLNKLGVKNDVDNEGNTALHIAYQKKRKNNIINTLIKIGVNPLQKNKKGLIPKQMLNR